MKKLFNIQETFAPQVQTSCPWNQSPCTPPHQELSKETKTKHHGTKPMHPSSSSRAFQRDQDQTSWNQTHAPLLIKSFPKRPRPNVMEPSPCTPPPQELSKETTTKCHGTKPPCTPPPRELSKETKTKCHGTKPMHPSSSRAFQRDQDQEHDLKHPGLVDLISTKQNTRAPTSAPFTRCQLWHLELS